MVKLPQALQQYASAPQVVEVETNNF
jgi:hypothetical protein